ncbi:MAG: Tex family protein [bacterium]
MLLPKDLEYLCSNLSISKHQASQVITMLDEGMTVPFISRYRKEKTDSLDEEKVQNTKDLYDYIRDLNARKTAIIKSISEQDKLNPELKQKIEQTYKKSELEDLYLPFKPKRRTKATIAIEKGFQALADKILNSELKQDVSELAQEYLTLDKECTTIQEVSTQAGYIIAEIFSENPEVRKKTRDFISQHGLKEVWVDEDWQDKRTKYEQYYKFSEALRTIPSHRILAIKRGEKEKILKSKISFDKNIVHQQASKILNIQDHPRNNYLDQVLDDSLNRLIIPSVLLDIDFQLKKEADEKAIEVFAANLEKLLLSPPAGNIRVMAVDPGFRTGCKVVVLDETGKLLDYFNIFPHHSPKKIEQARNKVLANIEKYKTEAVVIGNGTASRETKNFFKDTVAEKIIVSLISEAGASVYSASKEAREEFPKLDVTYRGSVSIGRRFQDPLAELVKIEPKSIGVGQYQHDVNQTLLKYKLDNVVFSVVNRVGVELNTASYHLLKYVSGIGNILAKNIVSYRNENGMFKQKTDLMEVYKFGEKSFQQSAGFLRVAHGKNILDATGIHPETYPVVEKISQHLNLTIPNLIGNEKLVNSVDPQDFVTDEFGLPTIHDILIELKTPGRDPREDFLIFEFTDGVMSIEDIKPDMILSGVVTNVTLFGAFVDIGIHQDGLVHVSEISHRYIKTPDEVLSVGDKVKVKVLKVDKELQRITLSLKALKEKPPKVHQKKKRKKKKKIKQKTLFDEVQELKKKWDAR